MERDEPIVEWRRATRYDVLTLMGFEVEASEENLTEIQIVYEGGTAVVCLPPPIAGVRVEEGEVEPLSPAEPAHASLRNAVVVAACGTGCYTCCGRCCYYGCCGDPCCGSSDPCCGSPDPCCDVDDPCCGDPDPCCHSDNPCCGVSDDPCCASSDPCCNVNCDDGNPCTVDYCAGGWCHADPKCAHLCCDGECCSELENVCFQGRCCDELRLCTTVCCAEGWMCCGGVCCAPWRCCGDECCGQSEQCVAGGPCGTRCSPSWGDAKRAGERMPRTSEYRR